ncbi:MAG: M48 family metallopeptidase [Acetobacteraceae bacterium]|nr:M48 family metallopeptidase [Acetobacteraceae bacterium]
MPVLLIAFAAVSLATTLFDLYLRRRQATYVARHRAAVPFDFAATVSLAEHQRAADYEIARLRLGRVAALVSLAVGLAWAFFGYDLLYGGLAGVIGRGLTRSVAFIAAVSLVSSLLDLPFAAYRAFRLEQRFGFNRTTKLRFAADRLKALALSTCVGVPLLYGLFWLMHGVSGLWWVYAWAGSTVLIIALMEAYPRWIAPLFNRFTPLDGALRARVEALLRRCGFEASGLFIMDASKRSTHGNAYFSGFGRMKRIVLFDTLVAQNSEDELEAVLAHELGHYKLGHVITGLLQTAVLLLLAFFAIGYLCKQPWLLSSFGIIHRDDALALMVCILVIQMGGPLVSTGANWLSRRHEYQADDFARQMVGAAPMISALVKLSRDNASTLTTDPLFALVNFSHPPVPLRVRHLREHSVSGGAVPAMPVAVP